MYKFVIKINIFIILFIAIITSCKEQNEPKILIGYQFEDVLLQAEKEQKYLCIILTSQQQQHNTIDLLNSQLTGDYKSLPKKTIFNIVDIFADENRWYEKWLCPISIPLICVFSPDGALLNLLPDLRSESFAYMKKTIKENQTDDEYYYYNRFGMNKKQYVVAMDFILKAKRKFDAGHNIDSLINTAVEKVNYPLGLFLKMKNEERQHDSFNMIRTSQELLSINTPYELLLYNEEYIEAKKILNPSFDISIEPYLEVNSSVIKIDKCEYGEKKPFFVVLKNAGKRPIKITMIETSCSCVSFLGNDTYYVILAQESIHVPFDFYAEQKGEIERSCYFVSDARNPVIEVKIFATVQEE